MEDIVEDIREEEDLWGIVYVRSEEAVTPRTGERIETEEEREQE